MDCLVKMIGRQPSKKWTKLEIKGIATDSPCGLLKEEPQGSTLVQEGEELRLVQRRHE